MSSQEDVAEAVASYPTARRAAAATARLVELGYDEHEVAIAPHDYRPLERPGLAARVLGACRTGAVRAGVAVAVVTAVLQLGVSGTTALVVLGVGGAVIGALLGGAAAALDGTREFEAEKSRAALRPDRYDVVVRRDAGPANHALARWWDPAA
jgi:hypothetical protein